MCFINADAAASDISEASNWAEDAAMYSSDSQLSEWEQDQDSSHEDPASPQPADIQLADALQLADDAITGAATVRTLSQRGGGQFV